MLLACHISIRSVYGQVKFYTQLSESVVSPKQTFQVQYIIEGAKDFGHFSLPEFDDFRVEEVFDVPVTPTINQKTKQVVDTYSKIVILSPRRTGRFTIPGATVYIDGKLVKSNAATVTVLQTGLRAAPGYEDVDAEEESELYIGDDIHARIRKNFFIRIEANKTSCYVGEPLMVVYKVYSRLHTNSQVVKRPSLTGFSVLEMVDSYDGKAEVEMLNGLPYYTSVLRKVQLFPLQEGKFVLDAAEIESVIRFVKINATREDAKDGFRRMFGGQGNNSEIPARKYLDYRMVLKSDPLTITVKPLPATGQPAGFAGAVGNFSLALQRPVQPICAGDLVKLRVVISGSGNLSLLTAPDIQWPEGVDTADPKVKETINRYIYPATGSKTFEYAFAAPDSGTYIIPAARFSYFDPVQMVYKTATTDSAALHVLPAAQTEGPPAVAQRSGNGLSGSLRHWYLFAAIVTIILAWIGYQTWQLRKARIQLAQAAAAAAANAGAAKPEPAQPTPTEILFRAQRAIDRGKPTVFYHELEQALWQFIAMRYNVLPSALNQQNVLRVLKENNVSDEVIENFAQLMQELQWALYTPDQSAHDMTLLLEKARQVIAHLQPSNLS